MSSSPPHPAVLASLRSADPSRLDEERLALEAAGIDGFHIDVMDGRLVEERSFDPAFVRGLRATTTKLIDVHLLTERPEEQIAAHADAGADRIAFHLEAASDPLACVRAIRSRGAAPGLVCFPGTPLTELDPFLAELVLVNPLGVDPRRKLGFQESTYERIAELVRIRSARELSFRIQADGGVWDGTRDALVAAGADELVGGYPIFSTDDYELAIRRLRTGS